MLCLERKVDTDMKIDEFTLPSVNTYGGGEIPPSTGLTPMSSPKFKAAMLPRIHKQGCPPKTLRWKLPLCVS